MHVLRLFRTLLCVLLLPGALAGQSCTGLCLQQVSCPGHQTTSISGTVYAPNGYDPLPNVTVFIPTAPLAPIPSGVTCTADGTPPSGSPLVQATTAIDGSFFLINAPVGTNIPLVVQAGKWRRQLVVPSTTACTDTSFSTRMPKSQSEGDIPMLAVVTGRTDQLECVLHHVGLADSEFTNPGGGGRVNLYLGNNHPGAQINAATPNENVLMGSPAVLNQYDMVLLASQGSQIGSIEPPAYIGEPPYLQDGPALPRPPDANLSSLAGFVNAGGRAVIAHLQSVYLDGNPYLPQFATWNYHQPNVDTGGVYLHPTVNQGFPEAQAFAQWLQVDRATSTIGQLEVVDSFSDVPTVPATVQSWFTLGEGSGFSAIEQFVAHTPLGAANACGRVIFDDFPMEAPTFQKYPTGLTYPSECYPGFQSSQGKAVEWDLFELTTVQPGEATLTPTPADFGSIAIGFSSASQTFTWTNESSIAASVYPKISVGDFTIISSDCTYVAAGGSCQLTVIFTPTALGARTGVLTIQSTGPSGALSAFLSGIGVPPLTLSATELQFYGHPVGSSTTLPLLVTNIATGAVPFPSLALTGHDYTATSNCGSSIRQGDSCVIYVTFVPTIGGLDAGTLNVGISPQVSLYGVGEDFDIGLQPPSGTVIAGRSISLGIVTTPNSGFVGNLSFTCTNLPPAATCAAGSVTIGPDAPVTSELALSTISKYTVVGYGSFGGRGALYVLAAAAGLLLLLRRRRGRSLARTALLALLLGLATWMPTGCSGKYPDQNPSYTPPGTYTITVTAMHESIVRSATYVLTVDAK